eukprot:TRINITY_DN7164_c0_g1_i2.p2 TRINITY_DN7164_c0_g1~~TRINITY_DN7164_c0_g1_i2.p2  ORF type:complete len:182 (-),score=60.57 TRINITY_DN7164_c0_g1_i2:28-573(-)
MLATVNNKAVEIKRVSTGPLHLGDLPVGKWRVLTKGELALLGVKEKEEPTTKDSTKKDTPKKKETNNTRDGLDMHGMALDDLIREVKAIKEAPTPIKKPEVSMTSEDREEIEDKYVDEEGEEFEEIEGGMGEEQEGEENDFSDIDFDEDEHFDDLGEDEYMRAKKLPSWQKERPNMFSRKE